MTYEIYQVKSDRTREFGFVSLDFLTKHYGGVDKDNYQMIYSSDVIWDFKSIENLLEIIFREFNINRPRDFIGHSLSESDVVVIDGIAYYCDDFGWKRIEFEDSKNNIECSIEPKIDENGKVIFDVCVYNKETRIIVEEWKNLYSLNDVKICLDKYNIKNNLEMEDILFSEIIRYLNK